jgi:DNA-binding XRE family transcriptional regulator
MNLEKLVKIRKDAGYTQQMLASHFGFTRQNWSAKERGLQHFRLSEIKELKELLGLSKDEIYDIFIGD